MTYTRYLIEEKINYQWRPLGTQILLRTARFIAAKSEHKTRIRRVITTVETVKPFEVR